MTAIAGEIASIAAKPLAQIVDINASVFVEPYSRIMHYASNWNFPNIMPEPEAIIKAWYQGRINDFGLEYVMQSHGLWPPMKDAKSFNPIQQQQQSILQSLWTAVLDSEAPVLSISEAIDLYRRKVYTPQDMANTLQRHGWRNRADWKKIMAFGQEIPGPSELVHFVLRHGFEPSVIRANRLGEEFPTSAREWFGKLGLDYKFKVTDPFTQEIADTTWADMYWQTHWVPISPTQAYEMLQRLRPERMPRFAADFPGLQPFTLTDVRRWLRVNDYPPAVRDQLTALSYRVIGRIDVRKLYSTKVIQYDEMVASYQDMGYNKEDSTKLADLTKRQVDASRKKPWKLITVDKIRQMYEIGVIGIQDATDLVYQTTIDNQDDLTMYLQLPAAGKAALSGVDPHTQFIVQNMQLDDKMRKLSHMIAAYKAAYLKGRYTKNDITNALAAFGMDHDKISDLFVEWDLLHTTRHAEINAAKIMQWGKLGILRIDQVTDRLTNLGYKPDDIVGMIAEASYGLALTQARANVAAAKSQQQRIKALQQQQKALLAEGRSVQKQLNRYATVANLVKWFIAGKASEAELRTRLDRPDAESMDIERIIDDAKQKRAAAAEKQAKAAASPPAGQPADTSGTNGVPNADLPADQGGPMPPSGDVSDGKGQ